MVACWFGCDCSEGRDAAMRFGGFGLIAVVSEMEFACGFLFWYGGDREVWVFVFEWTEGCGLVR
jgi:hypothetical protein